MAWDDERVEQLKKLWAEGLSASQIAGKMGGVTRNAVIGKVHRLGLSGRATPAKPQRGRNFDGEMTESPAVAAKEPAAPAVEPPDPAFEASLMLSADDRTTVATLNKNMCRWPMGDPATDDFHFCGQSAQTGKSYCAYHAQLAFQPSHRKPAPRQEAPRLANPAGQKRRIAG